MVGYVARALLVLTLLPLESAAQTPASTSAESLFQASIAAITNAPPPLLSTAPQPSGAARAPWSRRAWIVLGTGIGFGGGVVFGEYYFGRHLDMPHGPDMLLGGMIGASAGALVAWVVTRGGTPRAYQFDENLRSSVTRTGIGLPLNSVGENTHCITEAEGRPTRSRCSERTTP